MHMGGTFGGHMLFGLVEIPPVKLNARQVDTAKPKDKPYKLSDGGGIYLLVTPKCIAVKSYSSQQALTLRITKSGYRSTTLIRSRCSTQLILWLVM
ncbi:DUF4102 domain-containing protein [Klebsiella pneumoniae]|nr:DUF4102 domain-containing protein [Klebsiella pneumoniae]